MLAKHLALALSALLVTACGVPAAQSTDKQDDRSSSGLSDDATGKKKKKKAADGEQQNGQQTASDEEHAMQEDLDCSGIMLHEGHDTCDQDDVDAADNPSGASEQPAEEGAADGDTPAEEGETPDQGEQPAEPKPAEPKPEEPAKDPNVVEFRIKAGTGTNPLNTPETFVAVKVGQTLRLINDDTVRHRLHTGGAPCPHGQNFEPGASYDCVVTKTIDTVANPGAVYEHISGPTALFYLKATN